MAKFKAELPNDLMKEFKKLEQNTEEMMKEMTRAGAEEVYDRVVSNMKKAFKNPKELIAKTKITKSYRTPSDDGINTKVAVYGYIKEGKKFTRKNSYKKSTGKSYESDGVPAPLVVIQREYGNSRGEKKIPIFRPAFNKAKITTVMEKVQEKYLPKE
jgi:ElaB/YqjD/DUF883 family membrane-anchored ribosome-binding protein